MVGHIKVDRKILEWEWYQDSKMVHLFLHLLLNANHKDGSFQGTAVKRGQLIIGRNKLSKDLTFSEQQVRTCLDKLKLTNEITIKSTNKFSIVTICKYDSYQSQKKESNQQDNQQITNKITNEQPTNNQQITTNNNTLYTYNSIISNYLKEVFLEKEINEISEIKYFDMVVLEMNKVWMKWKPNYSFLQEADYPALLRIAYLIASRKKISKYEAVNIQTDEIVKSFDKIAEYISKTDNKFYRKLPLSGIAIPKNFQSIEEEMRTAKNSDKQLAEEAGRISNSEYFNVQQ